MAEEGRFGERYGLACSECGGHTAVTDSRPTMLKAVREDLPDRPSIRRRRRCDICGHRMTTFEVNRINLDTLTPAQLRIVWTAESMIMSALNMIGTLKGPPQERPQPDAEPLDDEDDRTIIGGAPHARD